MNGSASSSSNRLSPISVFCATLVKSLWNVEPVICLQFFCGLHTSDNDPLNGPGGLIRSLISQLMSLYDKFDLSFINSRSYRDHIEQHELGHLCELFRGLLHQLPIDTVVFGIIDGVSFYERADYSEDMCFVIRKLREITERVDLNAIFKLLMTSIGPSRQVKQEISSQDHLPLPQDVGARLPPLTPRQMSMQFSRPLALQRSAPDLRQQGLLGEAQESDDDSEKDDFDEGNLV